MRVPSVRSLNKKLSILHPCYRSLVIGIVAFLLYSGIVTTVSSQSPVKQPIVPFETNISPVPTQDALINISVNGKEFGNVEAKLENEAPFLKKTSLEEMFSTSLTSDHFNRIFRVQFSRLEWIGDADLHAVGLFTSWDLSTLLYRISVPIEFATLQEVDFSPPIKYTGKEYFTKSFLSSVLNLSGNADGSFATGSNTFSGNFDADGLIKVWDLAIEGSASVTLSNSQISISLSKARLLYDVPAAQGRLVAGKVIGEGIAYQSKPELIGVTLGSLYIFSNYDRSSAPSIAFMLEEPSKVRILINGIPVRIMSLDRGKYRIFDLPFSSGLNTVELQIADSTGIETWLRPASQYIAAEGGILVSGQSEFGISAGVGYEEPDEPFVSGFFRHGLDYRVSYSIFGQADTRSVLAGGALIAGLPIGIFTAEASAVYAWDERSIPFSYAANLRYQIAIPSKPNFPNTAITAEYFSSNFFPPNPTDTLPIDSDARARVSVSISGTFNKFFVYSLSSSWNRVFKTPASDLIDINASMGYSTNNGISISLNSHVSIDPREGNTTLTLGVSAVTRIPRKPNASLSFIQYGDGLNTVSYTDKINLFGDTEFTLQGQNLVIGSLDRKRISSNLRKSLDFADITFNGGLNYGGATNSLDGSISLRASTALAYADGTIALSRPLYDSFVIVLPEADAKNQKTTLSTTSSGSVTTRAFPVALSLASYRQALARVDFPEADANLVASIPESLLMPKYRSGIVYRVGIEKHIFVIGRLVDQGLKPYAYIAGDVFDGRNALVESVFTYEDGSFQAFNLEIGAYRIEWPASIGSSSLTIPETAEGNFDLGNIVAERSEENVE